MRSVLPAAALLITAAPPADEVWLDRSFDGIGLVNGSNPVNDGVDTGTCRNNGQQVWTYNQDLLNAV